MPTWTDIALGAVLTALLAYVAVNLKPPGWLERLAGAKDGADAQIEMIRKGER